MQSHPPLPSCTRFLGKVPLQCLHLDKKGTRNFRHFRCGVEAVSGPALESGGSDTLGKERPVQLKPPYKKYLDAAGLARHNYSEWKRLSGQGVHIPPPTIYSRLIYPLQFIKYNFVPEFLRYAWFLVWIRLVAAYSPYHKKLVLEGAKLDAYLQHQSQPATALHVNKRDALLRYHWKMSPVQNLGIRFSLLKAALPNMLFRWKQKNIQQAEDSNLAAPKVII